MSIMDQLKLNHYAMGADAANRALDRTGLTASDLLVQWTDALNKAQTREDLVGYEYAKGFCDTLREFLDDRAR